MGKGISAKIIGIMILALAFGLLPGQGTNYLAQKLMVENDLRQRIQDALSKIVDEQRYVIDVSVKLDISNEMEEQVTIVSEGVGKGVSAVPTLDELARSLESEVDDQTTSRKKSRFTGGLPIPGFEFEIEEGPGPTDDGDRETSVSGAASPTPSTSSDSRDKVLSRVFTDKRPSMTRIKKMDISIILQEGAAPELIQNIRQVVMVASRFDRSRGDVLSVMTASFKERRDERTAEQILLKNIAEKIEGLEQKRDREDNWERELEKYKEDEARRREEDRTFFQSEVTKLELVAKDRAFQVEKQEILRRDSLKLKQLNDEIESLKNLLASAGLSDSEEAKTQSAVQTKEKEKARLDSLIDQKVTRLDAVQADLDRLQGDMNGGSTTTVVLLSLLGALLLIAVIVLVVVLMNNWAKQPRYAAAPPPWAYPPRPRRKKKSSGKPPVADSAPVAPQPQAIEEDPAVLQSEVEDMKQAVVSMSVGQPNTATRIVKEWMEEEAPPPPEPEAPAPAPSEPEEEESGKKKKKKKKKK